VRLRTVVDDVLLEASQRAHGRVRFERAGDDPTLAAVPAELRILLHTLVVNALEASPDGGRVQVEVQAAADGAVRIAVSDEGGGVATAIAARLFEPHVSSKPSGAGMGLYLAERLARLRYRGALALEPALPRGTVARLVLHDRQPPA
jgi:signal transduction histidine kinase